MTDAGARTFAAELHHFGGAPRPLTAEFFLLEAGEYRWSISTGADDADRIAEGSIRIEPGSNRLDLEIPSRIACRLKIEPAD